MSGVGFAAYKLSFELSPIILTHGIAENIPGSMLPIVAVTQAVSFATGLLSGGDVTNLDDFFAHFEPSPGSALIDQALGKYPFANQRVAGNALIAQPLRFSLIMKCPARGPFAYYTKLATMMALQATLDNHAQLGGTYTVITPSYFYTNCVLLRLEDVSRGDTKQPQTVWRWDFEQPLLTEEQAQQAQNSLMSKLSSGVKISGQPTWSNPGNTVGLPTSLATPSLVPSASSTAGSGVAGPLLKATP